MSEEIKNEEKNINEELKDFNKEVLGKLDSPLVVHRKGDASYEEDSSQYEMYETHTGEERPTLARHRFKREKKKSKAPVVIVVIIVVLAAAFAGLYYTGNIQFISKETTATTMTSTMRQEITKDFKSEYRDTIVIKDVYIFVDGEEVKGIEGLQRALKYENPSPKRYKIILENENKTFYNFEVLPLLEAQGFFDDTTEFEHVSSTGLIAEAETTTLPPETTAKNKKKNKKKNKQNKENQN